MCHLRYLLTNNTHEIPNFIHCLAVPIILFPLTCVEEEKIFNELKIVKAKLFTQMSQDFLNALIRRHGFDKIKETAVDKLRNTKQRIIFKIEANFHVSIFIIKVLKFIYCTHSEKDIPSLPVKCDSSVKKHLQRGVLGKMCS